jgi:hypothetical protein
MVSVSAKKKKKKFHACVPLKVQDFRVQKFDAGGSVWASHNPMQCSSFVLLLGVD